MQIKPYDNSGNLYETWYEALIMQSQLYNNTTPYTIEYDESTQQPYYSKCYGYLNINNIYYPAGSYFRGIGTMKSLTFNIANTSNMEYTINNKLYGFANTYYDSVSSSPFRCAGSLYNSSTYAEVEGLNVFNYSDATVNMSNNEGYIIYKREF